MSEPNRLLRLARERTPSCRVPGAYMSREELAEAVALWACEHDDKHRGVAFDANHLGKLERGTVRCPHQLYIDALCAVLHATPAELGFHLAARLMSVEPEREPSDSPPPRELMGEAHGQRGAPNLKLLSLTDSHQLIAQLDDIALRYETLPSASLLAEAGQCHASIALQLCHEQREPMRQKLHAAAAASALLMSQLVWDVSQRRDYATTMVYCDEAIAHGRECSDVLAIAHAELRKCFAVLYGHAERRDPLRGLNFAQAAAEHSCSVSDALRGLSLLHVGEAYAMLGEHRQCERALGAAETAFEQIDGNDPGASFYSPTQLGRLTGSCYLFLGHPERAEPFLDATAQALHTGMQPR